MKTIIAVALIAVVFSAFLFLFGCGSKPGLYGQAITETNTTRIGDILAHPEQFKGKTVKIQGKIREECPAGGWFMLKDETGTVYVNLHPSDFAIPQASGHQAVAEGTVNKEGTQVSVIGKGAQIT